MQTETTDTLAPLSAPTTTHRPLNLASLSLQHFRNYHSARIEISPKPVVLVGRNGAGKTNILEAISLLTPGRGLRRARLSEIDNLNEPGEPWAVSATLHGMQGEVKIGTGRDPEAPSDQPDRRTVRIDGKTVRSQAELGRHLAILWLTPQMEQLFNEGSSSARKFLDRLVFSFDPDHASRINEYDYAMRERNRLLQSGKNDPTWLDSLEQAMAEAASAIAQARLHAVANINHAMAQSRLSFPKAHIAIHGFAEERLQMGEAAVHVERALKNMWVESRRQDAAAGRTLSGVHRSEMQVTHIEKHMQAEACSTGEQKALLLSIVLAQAHAGALWRGIIPVLLLDEIITHLDGTRRLELFQEICQIGAQIWMTGTEVTPFAELKEKVQYFHIENGHVEKL